MPFFPKTGRMKKRMSGPFVAIWNYFILKNLGDEHAINGIVQRLIYTDSGQTLPLALPYANKKKISRYEHNAY